MINLISKLIDVLKKECEIYKEIRSLASSKKEIIIEGKVSELESLVKLEQSMLIRVGKLDRQREDLTGKITAELGLNNEDATITNICNKIDNKQAEELLSIKEEFMKVLKELKNMNELNSRLVKNSLDYINFSINLLGSSVTLDNTYADTGQASGEKTKHFFDVKL